MSNTHIINFDEVYAKTVLERQHEAGEKRVGKLSRAIRSWQREYDRLDKILRTSEVVSGIGTAVGFLSGITLSLSSDNAALFNDVQELIGTPAGDALIGVMVGGFLVAGAGFYLGDKVFDKMKENQEVRDDLYESLDMEEEILKVNENAQAINYLKGEIHGDDVYLPDDVKAGIEGEVPIIREDSASMPKIVIIDERGGFPESGPFFQSSSDLATDDLEQ